MCKRIIVIIGAALIAVLLIVGCGSRQEIPRNGYERFKVVEYYSDGYEVVDKDTGYGYFIFYEREKGGNALPLFDEYGNPYQENGWRDYGE